jgi:beta-mannosidase
VVYRRAFKFKPEEHKRFFLRVQGAFYWSTPYLNGARLGANEGYFFPVDYEITDLLQKDNTLLIELDCPREDDKTAKRQLTGVFHHWDCLDPKTNPGGLWLPVEVLSTGPARVIDPLFTTAYLGKDQAYARITGQATLETSRPARLLVRISFLPLTFEGEPQVFERELRKGAGSSTYHYHLDLKTPRLWWTHDHGRPDLYILRYEVFVDHESSPSDTWETAFGVRTFELRDYIAFLNGRRLFLRGNNYPPGDTRIAAMTRERCDEDVRLARECHLNFLRVHAHVDHPLFYQVCDEAGMLLWQDFPLQWAYRAEVEPQALRQLERMIFHLGNHPCIAIWCMHNEPFKAPDLRGPYRFGSISKALFSFFIYSRNRERLDPKMARQARFLDPSRPATECSGERGLFRPPGDGHFYYGWYSGPLHWFHRLYRNHPHRLKFVTEFGSQSLPNLESAVKFMDLDLRKVDWKRLRDRHHYQPWFMKWIARLDPRKFPDLQTFITATQEYQAEVNRYYLDRIRALKFKPAGGVAPFLLLDSNPAVQWSVIDYFRVPKSSYFALQKAMSPVYAFIILDRPTFKRGQIATVPLFAVNDTWEPAPVTVTMTVTSPVGERIMEESWSAELPADCEAQVLARPQFKLRWEGDYRIHIGMKGPVGDLDHDYRLRVR